MCVVLLTLPPFFQFVQARQGRVLNDIVLDSFQPLDFSLWIFGLIYTGAILGTAAVAADPRALLLGLQAYALLYLLRIAALYFWPLEPPSGIVLLKDPLLGLSVYSNQVITKDLFFSGHTAFLFLMGLLVRDRWLKGLIFLACLVVGMLLIIQHVHYCIDIAAAPLFAWISFTAAKAIPK